MTYYNDGDELLYEDGVELVQRMNEEYLDLIEEDDNHDIIDAMDGWVTSFWQMAALLRATGLMGQAYAAVLDDVEMAVRNNRVVR